MLCSRGKYYYLCDYEMKYDKEEEKMIGRVDQSKGVDMGRKNLCFAMLVLAYLRLIREGERSVDKRELFYYCSEFMKLVHKNAYSDTNFNTGKLLIKRMVKEYEAGNTGFRVLKKHERLPIEEIGEIHYFFEYFGKGGYENWEIDKEKVEQYMEIEYQGIKSYFFIYCGDPENRVFKDPMVDFFYHEMKTEFNYYKVMMRMGVLEKDIDKTVNLEEYQEAMRRARKVIDLEVEAQNIQKARSGEENAAINTYLKQKEKREKDFDDLDDLDDFNEGMQPTTPKKKKYKEEDIKI